MKLMTQEIKKKIPSLYSNDGKDPKDIPIRVKFFNPMGRGTWYVTEGEEQEDGDWLFYGLARIHEAELGYFKLSELTSVRLPFGMKIERDMYFANHTLAEAKDKRI